MSTFVAIVDFSEMGQFLSVFLLSIELDSIAKVKHIRLEMLFTINRTIDLIIVIPIGLKPFVIHKQNTSYSQDPESHQSF